MQYGTDQTVNVRCCQANRKTRTLAFNPTDMGARTLFCLLASNQMSPTTYYEGDP